MPMDFELTEDRDIRIDTTGDHSTVHGVENIRQQFVNAIFRGTEEADIGLINRNSEENLRIAIARELDQLSYAEDYQIQVNGSPPKTMEVEIESGVLESAVSEEVSI